jgi:hypothetical protein
LDLKNPQKTIFLKLKMIRVFKLHLLVKHSRIIGYKIKNWKDRGLQKFSKIKAWKQWFIIIHQYSALKINLNCNIPFNPQASKSSLLSLHLIAYKEDRLRLVNRSLSNTKVPWRQEVSITAISQLPTNRVLNQARV